jgi:hypothetical protein
VTAPHTRQLRHSARATKRGHLALLKRKGGDARQKSALALTHTNDKQNERNQKPPHQNTKNIVSVTKQRRKNRKKKLNMSKQASRAHKHKNDHKRHVSTSCPANNNLFFVFLLQQESH